MSRQHINSLVTALGLSLGLSAEARAEGLIPPPPQYEPMPIYGGTEAGECDWPTTVYMDGCTGTLVHPQLVVFAAHCMFFAGGQGPDFAGFGESADSPARQVPIDQCTMYPGWTPGGRGDDVAFCTLAEPVNDVPIVPILMGCETEILASGQPVTLVGFGVTESDVFGVKHAVQTTINSVLGAEVNLGGGGTSSCNGDSGGPAYVQLEDGSWRVFGVTSRGTSGSCADESIYGLIHEHIELIESTAGLDVTPCHDVDGTWNPTEGCTGFPMNPGVGETPWAMGCAQTELSPPSMTCGDPIDGGPGTGDESGGDESGGAESGETGLDGTAGTGASDTGLPGGTDGESGPIGGSDGADPGRTASTAGNDGGLDDEGPNVDTCACRSEPARPSPLWLLLMLAAPLRRRRR